MSRFFGAVLKMTEATPLSPELSRSVSALARALVAAARRQSLSPPDHPAARTSVDRLRPTRAAASAGEILSFGVTPETLLIPRGVRRILLDRDGHAIEDPLLVNTWEADSRGKFRSAVVEEVDPDTLQVDPLTYM